MDPVSDAETLEVATMQRFINKLEMHKQRTWAFEAKIEQWRKKCKACCNVRDLSFAILHMPANLCHYTSNCGWPANLEHATQYLKRHNLQLWQLCASACWWLACWSVVPRSQSLSLPPSLNKTHRQPYSQRIFKDARMKKHAKGNNTRAVQWPHTAIVNALRKRDIT